MEQQSILSDEEIEKLVIALGIGRDGNEFTEEELLKVINWAEEVTIGHALLQNVMTGTVSVDVKDGEVVFNITEKGKKEVEQDFLYHHPQTDLLQ